MQIGNVLPETTGPILDFAILNFGIPIKMFLPEAPAQSVPKPDAPESTVSEPAALEPAAPESTSPEIQNNKAEQESSADEADKWFREEMDVETL